MEQEIQNDDFKEPQLQLLESQPVEQPVKRRIAHMHPSDKRANQRGPIVEGVYDVVGNQSKTPCYEMVYHIHNPGGFKINEKLYQGRVTVPECVGNYLCTMDAEWMKTESSLFRNNPVSMHWTK